MCGGGGGGGNGALFPSRVRSPLCFPATSLLYMRLFPPLPSCLQVNDMFHMFRHVR